MYDRSCTATKLLNLSTTTINPVYIVHHQLPIDLSIESSYIPIDPNMSRRRDYLQSGITRYGADNINLLGE